MFVYGSELKYAIFIEDIPMMLPTKLWFIWPGGFRGEDILDINQSETKRPVAAMFANGSGRNKQSL
jgi:hypothetical protein